MTGKASALGNRIKFESGTLNQAKIDPFGSDVVYNQDINGFLYRSGEAAAAEAREIAERRRAEAAQQSTDRGRAALQRYYELAGLEAKLTDGPDKASITAQKQLALKEYLASLPTTLTDADQATLKEIKADIAALKGQLGATQQAQQEQLAALEKRLAAVEAGQVTKTMCDNGQIARRGFQIMGPEGMRPFNQDERLVMAMYSSADPLIETLNEYSGRLLKPRANPATQLLPISREMTAAVRGQRAISDELIARHAESSEATDATATIAALFDQVVQGFNGEGP